MSRLGAVLLWSVLAAAFIGPGTVTTAASAGASHGLALLWALSFSVLACLVLQEAAARLAISGGENLAEAISGRYPAGAARLAVWVLVVGGVIVGCAAYEAGNLLGAVAGVDLLGLETAPGAGVAAALLGGVAALLLWFRPPEAVARTLALLVGVMGVAFLWCAVSLNPVPGDLLAGLLRPRLPEGSSLLALGLVGTTVVPYNLFLGSGLARGRLAETRFGIAVAVLLGGAISMAVVVVGTAMAAPMTFHGLSEVLGERLGPWAQGLLGGGLLAAGLSSAITAPLAAALTARGLVGGEGTGEWSRKGWKYRCVWGGVLLTGVAVAASGVRPIPVIILAQALNGMLLPAVAIFLWVAVNDRRRLGSRAINGRWSNLLTSLVVLVSLVLGLLGLMRAVVAATGLPALPEGRLLALAALFAALLALPIVRAIRRARRP